MTRPHGAHVDADDLREFAELSSTSAKEAEAAEDLANYMEHPHLVKDVPPSS